MEWVTGARGMYGLVVATDVPLPWAPRAEGAPDVHIVEEPVPARLPDAAASGAGWEAGTDGLLLRLPDGSRLLSSADDRICLQRREGQAARDFAPVVLGPALAAALRRRGRVALQGAAVDIGGRGIAIVGGPGAGCSTLAHALAERGHRILADDLVAVRRGRDGPRLDPGPPWLRLWQDRVERAGVADAEQVRPGVPRYWVHAGHPGEAAAASVPFTGLVAVQQGEGTLGKLEVRAPPPPAVARLLVRFGYRRRALATIGDREGLLATTAAIAGRVRPLMIKRPAHQPGHVSPAAAAIERWAGEAE